MPPKDIDPIDETSEEKQAGEEEHLIVVEPEVLDPTGSHRYRVETRSSEALVIHCGDPRFQTAFRDFIRDELGISNYMPVVVGGGIHAFGVQNLLPKNFKILWEQIKFALKELKLRQVIIINHEDCRWYEKMKGYHPTIRLPLKGKLDLESAALTIMKEFAGVQVRTFWASIDGDHINFAEVTPGA